jgi:hypothetical protein
MEMSELVEKFVQWLEIQGYYIGCYGMVVSDKEVRELIYEFDGFAQEMNIHE